MADPAVQIGDRPPAHAPLAPAFFPHVEQLHRAGRLRLQLWLSIAAYVAVVGVLSYRAGVHLNVPGHPNVPGSAYEEYWVLQDFRDTIYYPVVSFLQGHNPYDAAMQTHTYPVYSPFPLYSPLTLLVHLPFGLLPYGLAELVYFASTILLMLVLARLTLRVCGIAVSSARVVGLAAVLLLTRPGQLNLLVGQTTVTVVIGVYVALLYARKHPALAGLGLALATLKPTFGVPLVGLMLCRRDTRAVGIGVAIAGAFAAGIAMLLVGAAGGVAPFLAALQSNLPAFYLNPANDPVSSISRIDAVALLARVLGHAPRTAAEVATGLSIFALAAVGVRRLAREAGDVQAQFLSATIVCVAALTCTYHQTYDLLLLAAPVVALSVRRDLLPATTRWLVLVLLAAPLFNYLPSATVLRALDITGASRTIAVATTGSILLAALLTCTAATLRRV